MGKGVAVVVGGSVARLACAHEVVEAGWEAVVVEKAAAPAAGGGTGAGLGLDTQSMGTLSRWLSRKGLDAATLPVAVDLNRATDSETKAARTLTRDEGFNFRAAHWGDLHRRLHEALPAAVIVLWGTSSCRSRCQMMVSAVSSRRLACSGLVKRWRSPGICSWRRMAARRRSAGASSLTSS